METQMVNQVELKEQENGRFLRRVLKGNALFSGLSAIVFLSAAGPLSQFTGIEPAAVFVVLGLGFIPFAAFTFFTARQPEINSHFARTIMVLDALWVMGSLVILFSGWPPLTTAGKWFVGLTAEAVAILALLEYIGIRRLG